MAHNLRNGGYLSRPYLDLVVGRRSILEDTLRQMRDLPPQQLKKKLKVSFHGEEGDDEGGVRKVGGHQTGIILCVVKQITHTHTHTHTLPSLPPMQEFFMLVLHEVMNPAYGLFQEDEESHLIWFSDSLVRKGRGEGGGGGEGGGRGREGGRGGAV